MRISDWSSDVCSSDLVAVFRDEALPKLVDAARALGLHAIQLHGKESPAYISALRDSLPERCEIWAAGAVGSEVPPARPRADRTLFDTAVGGHSGGTGRTFDWTRLKGRSELRSEEHTSELQYLMH